MPTYVVQLHSVCLGGLKGFCWTYHEMAEDESIGVGFIGSPDIIVSLWGLELGECCGACR